MNTKKKHNAFRLTALQVQTSALLRNEFSAYIYIPDVKAMMSST